VLQPVDVLVVACSSASPDSAFGELLAFSSTAFKRVVRVLELAPSSTS